MRERLSHLVLALEINNPCSRTSLPSNSKEGLADLLTSNQYSLQQTSRTMGSKLVVVLVSENLLGMTLTHSNKNLLRNPPNHSRPMLQKRQSHRSRVKRLIYSRMRSINKMISLRQKLLSDSMLRAVRLNRMQSRLGLISQRLRTSLLSQQNLRSGLFSYSLLRRRRQSLRKR